MKDQLPTAARATLSGVFRRLAPTIWLFRGRVVLALTCVVLARLANIGVPVVLKQLIDSMKNRPDALAIPTLLLLSYGALRLGTSLFQELRGIVFARVQAGTTRIIALRLFEHLHALSLRFHLDRRTGGVARDVERGVTSVSDLIDWSLYMVLPMLFEIGAIMLVLIFNYNWSFALITIATLSAYLLLTFAATEWRLKFFRAMNDADTEGNSCTVDSLLNYETVKYFNSERHELERYDISMRKMESTGIASMKSASVLAIGQAGIIATGLTLLLWRAAVGVQAGKMSLGDMVMINAFLLQLAAPLNSLGMLYREMRQSLSNIDRMLVILDEPPEIRDEPGAAELKVTQAHLRFEQVDFGYGSDRDILQGIDIDIPPGKTLAVVGKTGSGKTTLARLLYRFYDVGAGRILIDDQDIRCVTQESLRQAIGIVPQDSVLFNESIYYNIAYGRPDASREEVLAAARAAHIHDFVMRLPRGYETNVGERGLKLSGGEKQRVAIARTLLKNPALLIFDEATSALDMRTERMIQAEIFEIASNRTTLIIAHRLSTIIDADQIIVLDNGRIVERGNHRTLLALGGRYSALWNMQQQQGRPRFDDEPDDVLAASG